MIQRATAPLRHPQDYRSYGIRRPPEGWEEQNPYDAFSDSLALAGLTVDQLRDPTKTKELAFRRQYVYWLLRTRGYSLPRIARFARRKDHTTVMYGIARFDFIASELGIL